MPTDYRIRPRAFAPGLAFFLVVLVAGAGAPSRAGGQEVERCARAHRFLTQEIGLRALTTADVIDDWRTRKMVPGCRITAAGITIRELAAEARLFYERLQAAAWSRTPNPMDAPNESSLRFRLDQTDCLFNIYAGGILLGTDAEFEVNRMVVPGPRETRYGVLVQCMPAMEAAPRP